MRKLCFPHSSTFHPSVAPKHHPITSRLLDGKKYSEKADVYSFGVLMWVLLTQEEPYKSFETQFAIYRFVLEGNRPEIPPATPKELVDITNAAWPQAPENRSSFHDLVAMLEAAQY